MEIGVLRSHKLNRGYIFAVGLQVTIFFYIHMFQMRVFLELGMKFESWQKKYYND